MRLQDTAGSALNQRLESAAWGLFLIMVGGLWLIPNELVPNGAWLIGVGIVMLGLNAARYVNQLPMGAFTGFLGLVALLLGASHFFGIGLPFFPILLILLGAKVVFDVLTQRPRTA